MRDRGHQTGSSSLSQNNHYSERAIWLVALERARLQPCRPELIMTRASAPEGFRGPVTNSSRQATSESFTLQVLLLKARIAVRPQSRKVPIAGPKTLNVNRKQSALSL